MPFFLLALDAAESKYVNGFVVDSKRQSLKGAAFSNQIKQSGKNNVTLKRIILTKNYILREF